MASLIGRALGGVRRYGVSLAVQDYIQGIASIHAWPMLGWLEIKQRYRRSVLGPFWLTISTGLMLAGMGPLFGRLFGQDISTYFPYLTVSLIVWMLIASLVNDACTVFIASEGFIRQLKAPLTLWVLCMVWKNLIIVAHNAVIVVLVMMFWPPALDWRVLQIPLGVLAIAINSIWLGTLFGLLSARYRDIPQIVGGLLQVLFFLTPVLWRPEMLKENQWLVVWNPFYHFLEIVRSPLVSATSNWFSWAVVLAITVFGFAASLLFFARYRPRVAYWV